jgi:hypothetical protein
MLDLTIREWSSLLGVLAFTGLLWRLIGFWLEMSYLERSLTLVLMAMLAVAAIGTYRLDVLSAPASGVVVWAILLRLVVLGLVVLWPRLVGSTPLSKV